MWFAAGLLVGFLLALSRPKNLKPESPATYWVYIFLPVVIIWSGAFLENGLFRSWWRWGTLPSYGLLALLSISVLLLVLGGIVHARHAQR